MSSSAAVSVFDINGSRDCTILVHGHCMAVHNTLIQAYVFRKKHIPLVCSQICVVWVIAPTHALRLERNKDGGKIETGH